MGEEENQAGLKILVHHHTSIRLSCKETVVPATSQRHHACDAGTPLMSECGL